MAITDSRRLWTDPPAILITSERTLAVADNNGGGALTGQFVWVQLGIRASRRQSGGCVPLDACGVPPAGAAVPLGAVEAGSADLAPRDPDDLVAKVYLGRLVRAYRRAFSRAAADAARLFGIRR